MSRDIFLPTIGVVKWQPAEAGCGFASLRSPVAVPDKTFGLTLFLDFIDRCHSLPSLLPPPAAVGSLPMVGMTVDLAVAVDESCK